MSYSPSLHALESVPTDIKLISPPTTQRRCERCEQLPPHLEGPGTLHLRFPLTHSYGKVLGLLRESGRAFQQREGLISVELPETNLAPFAVTVSSILSATELADVHVLFQKQGQLMQLADYLDNQSLAHFISRAQMGWLVDMINQDRLVSVFHPILDARTGEVFGHEALLRGRENERLVPPVRLFEVARGAGLLFQLDLAARRCAIRGAAEHSSGGHLFVNFTPTAIYDPQYCLRSTIELVSECGLTPEQVVFEVIESEHVADHDHLTNILRFYRERGFGVALDDVGAGYSSLNVLSALRPDFIKFDRELVSGVDCDPYKALLARKLLEAAQGLNIRTVAEGIETLGELEWLREHGADFVQGFLFARPQVPPTVPVWPFSHQPG
ncbi:putative cyclic di-GMP phosphodiesterase PdeC [Abditibacteriota bacterium]|nr:putative cyclic di-GMP phosphodiesterase PdeC [Abditibacteriota bacterium]